MTPKKYPNRANFVPSGGICADGKISGGAPASKGLEAGSPPAAPAEAELESPSEDLSVKTPQSGSSDGQVVASKSQRPDLTNDAMIARGICPHCDWKASPSSSNPKRSVIGHISAKHKGVR